MNIDALNLSKNIEEKFQQFKQEENFSAIAKLITYALQVNSRQHNLKLFGYIPQLFRTVAISADPNSIEKEDIYIGEPVVYQIFYSGDRQLYGLNYFYVFCYFKENSDRLNVYFQSANPNYKNLVLEDYSIAGNKISFEGCISSFNHDSLSIMSISDPGHFIPGITSSYYIGSPELNFPKLIAEVLERIVNLAKIKLDRTLLFGSSAGTFGALLSSTYLTQKTNVLAVNSQINIKYRQDIINSCFNIKDSKDVVKNFNAKLSCIDRFKEELNSTPNVYILANINDKLHQRNFNFYQNYIERFTRKNINNQSVFDSYYGVEGHGRPEPFSLKAKIKIAREILTMKSTP
ncbi:hypothetical protein I4641_05810 [Waterburya agarophytonicola K14]|uniref:Uncharacterized protein n=1 Tax=Waterburya agarophytonicola KI4 TaxID=2874699 RepID=A0A964BN51_9CYAN|nr:hypothetical protein [Waterburya agarophytonicola]MCC0176493.1 hypothetical protein [Waterburya agarophytonicola KI4]